MLRTRPHRVNVSKLNLSALWGVLIISIPGSLWLFTNMAWASDIERIEVRMIKGDLRDLRKDRIEYANNPEVMKLIDEAIDEAIDDLCRVAPDDRECH